MASTEQHAQTWDAEDKGSLILRLSWTFTAFGAALVILRGIAQGIVRKSLRSEDYWSLVTLVSKNLLPFAVDFLTCSTLKDLDCNSLHLDNGLSLLRQRKTF